MKFSIDNLLILLYNIIMSERVLDIWAIQNNPEEIYNALENITHDVVIFKHLICKFKIGEKLIFSCLYDTLI